MSQKPCREPVLHTSVPCHPKGEHRQELRSRAPSPVALSPKLEDGLVMRSELSAILDHHLHTSNGHLQSESRKERDLRLFTLIVNFQIRVGEFKAKLDREEREAKGLRFLQDIGSGRWRSKRKKKSERLYGMECDEEDLDIGARMDEERQSLFGWRSWSLKH
jgi:hypothetical protein